MLTCSTIVWHRLTIRAAGYKGADDLKSQYLDGTFDAVTMDGEIYGLPLELTNWCIYINKRIFRDAGLDPEKDYPKTWGGDGGHL